MVRINIHNCKVCGRVIRGDVAVCHQCSNDRREVYDVIRDYLEKYPGASKLDVQRDTGISISIINEFIKEGRFLLTNS